MNRESKSRVRNPALARQQATAVLGGIVTGFIAGLLFLELEAPLVIRVVLVASLVLGFELLVRRRL
ncbi:MAG: hypothetical protein M3383_06295 [Actinomycetota bacterium]|nr:hypothetical protein [Actinomycetota bacterium]